MEVPIIRFSYSNQTPRKMSFFTKAKEYLTEKFTPFLNNTKTMNKKVKIICCDNAGGNKTLEKNCAIFRRN